MKRLGWAALLVAWVVTPLGSTRVAAQDAVDRDPGRPELDSLTFVGVVSIDQDALAGSLGTRPSPWLPWKERRYFDPAAFELDLQRIVAHYADQGFPDARIVSYDVRPSGPDGVSLTVVVEEGPPELLDEIVLDRFADALPPETLAALREQMPIHVGERLVHNQALTAGELAATALKNRGFPHADVRIARESTGAHRVRLVYTAEPGTQAFFGPVEIAGNVGVDDEIVRRELAYRPGELYRLELVRASQRNLYGLQLFDFVSIEPIARPDRPTEVATRITVAGGKHRRLEFSGGWGTEENLRGEADWRHVNFYGGARVLHARGKWSSLDRGGELDLLQPYFFSRRTSVSLNVHSWFADELAYLASSAGGRVSVSHRFTPSWSAAVSYTDERASSRVADRVLGDPLLRHALIGLGLNPDSGEQSGRLGSLTASLQRSTTDSALNPRRGHTANLLVERAGGWLPGTFDYLNVAAEGTVYAPLHERLVLAGRVHAATIDPFGGTGAVPFYKRYFLGGSTSLRGWGRFEVGPLAPTGLPVGGFSLFETSLEARVQLRAGVGLVAFVDAGNVWRNSWELHLDDLRADVGPGLRYLTPVGPLRIDLAYQVTPIDNLSLAALPDRRWRVHFSIGQSF